MRIFVNSVSVSSITVSLIVEEILSKIKKFEKFQRVIETLRLGAPFDLLAEKFDKNSFLTMKPVIEEFSKFLKSI